MKSSMALPWLLSSGFQDACSWLIFRSIILLAFVFKLIQGQQKRITITATLLDWDSACGGDCLLSIIMISSVEIWTQRRGRGGYAEIDLARFNCRQCCVQSTVLFMAISGPYFANEPNPSHSSPPTPLRLSSHLSITHLQGWWFD